MMRSTVGAAEHASRPTTIHLLVMPGAHLLDIAAPAHVLGHPSLNLSLQWISPVSDVTSAQGLSLSRLLPLPDTVDTSHWLIVTGSRQARNHLHDPEFIQTRDWLKQHAPSYGFRAAICSGALLVASAGLLDGQRCTTHHTLITTLQQIAPTATVEADCLYTEAPGFMTSAGIATGLDLSLYLVARHWGHDQATLIARDTVLYHRRAGSASQESFWLKHRNHVCDRVHRVQDRVMSAPGDAWTPARLAGEVHVSERHLRRLFVEHAFVTIGDYLLEARITLAAELLADTRMGMAEIADRCALGSERNLRRQFTRRRGCSPSSYRRQQESGV